MNKVIKLEHVKRSKSPAPTRPLDVIVRDLRANRFRSSHKPDTFINAVPWFWLFVTLLSVVAGYLLVNFGDTSTHFIWE